MNLKAMEKCIKATDKLFREESTEVITARVYIPKADGIRVRSLGVPAKE